jgi:hypothetical protein
MSGDDSLSDTLHGLSIRDQFRMPMPTVPTGAAVIIQPEKFKTYEEMNEDERRKVRICKHFTHIREHLNLLQITTYREAMQKVLLFDSSTPSHRQSYNDRDDSRNSVRFIRTNKNFNYHGSNHRFQNQNGNGNGNGNSNANANTNQNQKSSQKPFENSMVNSSSDTELEESTNGCSHCQRNGHTDQECWKKFPDLKPKSQRDTTINLIVQSHVLKILVY